MIYPHWNAPSTIHAFSTTREPLHKSTVLAPSNAYSHFNLALHVDDDSKQVLANRQQLQRHENLPAIQWLNQVHGTHCHHVSRSIIQTSATRSSTTLSSGISGNESGAVELTHNHQSVIDVVEADAAWTTEPNIALAVMTADCLPILITDTNAQVVAAVHAGWRGLVNGIIEQQVSVICEQTKVKAEELICWLGPCIQQAAFQVGAEVREQFLDAAAPAQQQQTQQAFIVDSQPSAIRSKTHQKYLADLPALANLRFSGLGVPSTHIFNCELCTFLNSSRFYSYRRDGQTGRMVTGIMLSNVCAL